MLNEKNSFDIDRDKKKTLSETNAHHLQRFISRIHKN
jgi:hypothetical protein